MRRRLLPTVALLAVLSLVVAACGQKSGVHLATGGDGLSGDGAITGEVGETTPEGEVVIGYDEQGNAITAPAGSDAASAAVGGSGGTTSTRRGGTQTALTTTTTAKTTTTSPTKAWGPTVTIGIHAPITGAAPLPSSFQQAADFVSGYFNDPAHPERRPHNRTIDILIKDDQYQPAIATQRCTEMVKQSNAFLLIGAAGTDQIQACARYAASAGVPYLSAGVTEKGLRSLKNYFAISMSYKQQAPYLAKFMKAKYPTQASDPNKVYMVYSDTPNFGDAVSAFLTAFPGAKTYKLPRTPNQTDLSNAARDLCGKAQLAYPLMAPKDWLILVGQQSCATIRWAGVGVTQGVNEVAGNGCNLANNTGQFQGSVFFSPFPQTDVAKSLDPEFAAALGNRNFDDIYIALWNTTRGMIELLRRTGPDLTRAKFVATTENATGIGGPPGAMNPPLNYTPSDHFGARHVYVFTADCAERYNKYRTLDSSKGQIPGGTAVPGNPYLVSF